MRHAAGMLLALGCAFLHGAGALRLASLAVPRGAGRLVATVVIATTTAVVSALALGLLGLGSSRPALAAAAAATWLIALRVAPSPSVPLTADLATAMASARAAATTGALAALTAVSAVWTVVLPHPLQDSLTYHLPEAVSWLHDGRPGSLHDYLYWQAFAQPTAEPFPVAAFPATSEVVLSWWLALSRSFVLPLVWGTALLLIVGLAGWAGARALRAPRHVAGLTAAVLVTAPPAVFQTGAAKNDLAAYAFFVCGAALLAVAWHRPAALAPAVLAMGLTAGVKSTGLVLAVLLVGRVVARHRRAVREHYGLTAVVAATVLVVGGTWYLRNLALHGSPFWPLVPVPWGTPSPVILETAGRFVDDPARNVSTVGSHYLATIGGGGLLLLAGLLSPLLARRRAALLLAAAVALSLLQWATASFSGLSSHPELRVAYGSMVAETTRYLLPAAGLAALGLAGLSAGGQRSQRVVTAVLAVAIGANALPLLTHDGAQVPPLTWLAAATAGGALAGLLVRRAVGGAAPDRLRRAARPLVAVGLVVAAVGAAPLGDGLWSRHARTDWFGSGDMVRWLGSTPEFVEGTAVVAASPMTLAFLAGDRAQHPVVLLRTEESCTDVRARTRHQWVVLYEGGAVDAPRECLRGLEPDFEDGRWAVYAPTDG